MIRFAIVEDRAAYRQDLVRHLERLGDFKCVCECGSTEEAIERLPRVSVDVVLVDLLLPGREGIECIREIKKKNSKISVFVITDYDGSEKFFQALSAGADGYCLKRAVPARLPQAVRDVCAGLGFMGPAVARYVAEFFREAAPAERLTPAEQRVLDLLKKGISEKRIAEETNCAPDTVKTHVKRIYDKLHVSSRAELLMQFGIKIEKRA